LFFENYFDILLTRYNTIQYVGYIGIGVPLFLHIGNYSATN